jgi:hypothetical protein
MGLVAMDSGKLIAVASSYMELRYRISLLAMDRGRWIVEWQAEEAGNYAVPSPLHNKTILIGADHSACLYLWNVETRTLQHRYTKQHVKGTRAGQSGDYAIGVDDGALVLWHRTSGQLVKHLPVSTGLQGVMVNPHCPDEFILYSESIQVHVM